MSLYIVHKRNPYFPTGTWVESFDSDCQKALITTDENNRVRVTGHEGLLIPLKEVRPFMIKTVKNGIDKWGDR